MADFFAPAPTDDPEADTLILQSLLDSMSHRDALYAFADATYRITASLLIPSDVVMDGQGALFVAEDGLDDDLFRNKDVVRGNFNITFRNLRIDGNAGNQSLSANPEHGIALYNAHRVLIQNVEIRNCGLDGIYIGRSGTVHGQTVGGACTYVTVENSICENNWRNGLSVTRCDHFKFRHSQFLNNNIGVGAENRFKAGGIDLETNLAIDVVTNGEIHHCNFVSTMAPCLQIARFSGRRAEIFIHHCTFHQTGDRAIAVFTGIADLRIEDCVFDCVNASGPWINPQGQLAAQVTIQRNVVRGDDTAFMVGIGLSFALWVSVVENRIENFSRGIGIFNYSHIVELVSNQMVSCATPINKDSTVGLVMESNNS